MAISYTLIYFVCAPGIIFSLIYFDWDPLYKILLFVPLEQRNCFTPTTIILNFIRLSVSFLCLAESTRMFPGSITFCIAVIKIHLGILDALQEYARRIPYCQPIHTVIRYRIIFRNYVTLVAICETIRDIIEWLTAALLFFGLTMIVIVNFVTVKMYDKLPLFLYACFPCVCIMILSVLAVTLPFAPMVHVNSGEILRLCSANVMQLPANWRKLARKKLIGLRNTTPNAGLSQYRFFALTSGFKKEYYYAIVTYTITALLSVDIN